MKTSWYYLSNGQPVGPVDGETLRGWARTGVLPPQTLLWREGLADWVSAWRVEGLFAPSADGVTAPVPTAMPPAYSPWSGAAPPPEVLGYAEFWKRAVAWLIDQVVMFLAGILLACVVSPFVAILFAMGGISEPAQAEAMIQQYEQPINFGFQGVMILVQWLYFAVMESGRRQATVGKLLLNLKVTDLDGQPLSFARASGRYWGKLLSGLTLGVGYLMALWTKRRQALHDMVADTVVVNRG